MSTLRVSLKKEVDSSYEIEIGSSLVQKLIEDLKNGLCRSASRYAVITDETVLPLYGESIEHALTEAGIRVKLYSFPAGETEKSRKNKEMLEDAMLLDGYRRDSAVIAVGGGVVTDLAGFLAATFCRGIPCINYATTLLSAADASVGGKTAVNTPLATNLIGVFSQPKKVYIDVKTWETLEKRELSSGLAETVKHACLSDRSFFSWLEEHIDEILALSPEACMHAAEENCRIKYHVVEQDETETTGLREALNLGHTLGRAVETVSDYRLLHGEAVAIGLAFQAKMGEAFGYLTADERKRVIALLQRADLPVEIPSYIDRDALLQKLYTDKKTRNGRLRFVFQKGIGELMFFDDNRVSREVSEEEVRKFL